MALIPVLQACVGGASADDSPAWDSDGDGISNAVETNPPNYRLYGFDPEVPNTNPSVAHGTEHSGYIENGIKLPGRHQGYYHYIGPTWEIDQDDWGILMMLNVIEATARDWRNPPRVCTNTVANSFGVGDLSWGEEASRFFGGYSHPHGSHQNGRDVDIRFLRVDGKEEPVGGNWDPFATGDLIDCFLYYEDVVAVFIDVTLNGGWYDSTDPRVFHDSDHYDHFHVRVRDPDGTSN